jgi:SpoVK/Ycf46/Vps4 family AAA+-type ATPase
MDVSRKIDESAAAVFFLREEVRRQISLTVARLVTGKPGGRSQRGHLIFSGPPGTGKTSAVRLMTKILHELGYLSSGLVVETDMRELVGMYLGQASENTDAALFRAQNGALFIDQVSRRSDDDFSSAVTSRIAYSIESESAPKVIVLSVEGEQELSALLSMPEIVVRFPTVVRFPSFTTEDVVHTAQWFASDRGCDLADDALSVVREYANALMDKDHRGYKLIDRAGNSRFARNLIEVAETHRDTRVLDSVRDNASGLSGLSDAELTTLSAEDIRQAAGTLVSPMV